MARRAPSASPSATATVAQFGQGFASMAAPVKELKRAILSGSFRHGANPLLRMCFANVVAETDAAENEKFTKERARGRIDGAVPPLWPWAASWRPTKGLAFTKRKKDRTDSCGCEAWRVLSVLSVRSLSVFDFFC
ncbi:terminase TerL endonuclease subunit [Rhodoblastus acidophilus]|uniref:terminase TerL endonuclease subunit n=1 Tax=Rhodoblastus acidophilus TaxID=1074 RepID=UPI003CC86FD2